MSVSLEEINNFCHSYPEMFGEVLPLPQAKVDPESLLLFERSLCCLAGFPNSNMK